MLKNIENDINNKSSGYSSSWSFLYTGPETFRPNQKLIFVGLNPGGGAGYDYHPQLSGAENTNAYLDATDWIGNGTKSPLQIQVTSLFEDIAVKLGQKHEDLMRQSMAANYIPFRSQDWEKIEGKKEDALKFSQEMWHKIIDYTNPSIIVVMSELAHQGFLNIFKKPEVTLLDTNWGRIKYSVTEFDWEKKKRLLVRLPHLSRYRIFGREKSLNCTNHVSDVIAKYYRDAA